MSKVLQSAKSLVLQYHRALDAASAGTQTEAVCEHYLAGDYRYRGVRPFYELSAAGVARDIWSALKRAMPVLQRRSDIFFASHHDIAADNDIWVVQMGNFLGDFTAPWLGIPANGKTTYLPYATLHRVVDDKIAETVEFLDVLAVICQAGHNPYAALQSGAALMSPGPATHDGVQSQPAAADDTRASYALTVDMLTELAQSYTSPADHMARHWHADMNWFGPTGIGASLGFDGYRRGHTGPFEDKLETVGIHDWELALAEGHFSAVMWWPCLTMRNIGGFMGAPSSPALADMRVVDLYRRDGDKLAENWIFIDMLHFLAGQGVDLLANIGEPT